MFKQIILLVILSIVAIFFHDAVATVFHYVIVARNYVSHGLSFVFAGDHWGSFVRNVVMLAGIPLVIGLFVNAVYWLVKKQTVPIFAALIWIVWVIVLTSLH